MFLAVRQTYKICYRKQSNKIHCQAGSEQARQWCPLPRPTRLPVIYRLWCTRVSRTRHPDLDMCVRVFIVSHDQRVKVPIRKLYQSLMQFSDTQNPTRGFYEPKRHILKIFLKNPISVESARRKWPVTSKRTPQAPFQQTVHERCTSSVKVGPFVRASLHFYSPSPRVASRQRPSLVYNATLLTLNGKFPSQALLLACGLPFAFLPPPLRFSSRRSPLVTVGEARVSYRQMARKIKNPIKVAVREVSSSAYQKAAPPLAIRCKLCLNGSRLLRLQQRATRGSNMRSSVLTVPEKNKKNLLSWKK